MKFPLTLLLIGLLLQGNSQTSFLFRNHSINEGLSQSSVVDIAEDPSGFLWFATQDGLNRYDGKDFVHYQKNFDDITTAGYNQLGKLIAAKNNELWLISKGGSIERLNLYTEKFAAFQLLPDNKPVPSATSILIDDRNVLWIGTENDGLIQYDLSNKTYLQHTSASSIVRLPSNKVLQVFKDSRQTLWVLTSKGIIAVAINGNNATYKLPLSCSFITEDKSGNIWLGTFGNGLFKKGVNDTVFTSFQGFIEEKKFPADLVIETVCADKEGRVWVGTYGKGLYMIDIGSSAIYHFEAVKKDKYSLPFNDVLCIKEDRNGAIWIGTDGGGISCYNKHLNNFGLYSNDNLPENIIAEPVRSITKDSAGTIWVGTSSSGLSFINPQKKEYGSLRINSTNKANSSYERVVSLLVNNDDLWVGTQGNGLLLYSASTKTQKLSFHPGASGKFKLGDHTVWCLYPVNATSVWVGTNDAGLVLIDKKQGVVKQFIHRQGQEKGLLENTVRGIAKLNDSILCIGLENKGVQFFNAITDEFTIIQNKEILDFWKKDIVLKSLFYKAPFLWIGTFGNGLVAYNTKTNKAFFINESHGLPNNTVYGILPGINSSLWLSSNKGISRFLSPRDLNKVSRANFSVFTIKDGLQSNEFNTGASYKDADGRLYFGGIKGFNFFNPAGFIERRSSLPVYITGLTLDNKPFETDTAIAFKRNLEFPYNKNSFAFNFTAVDFVSSGRVQYAYKLNGYDVEWINAGDRAYAAYTNIPPGNYTFTVKATDLLSAQENTASIHIIITPPLWKRWWFIVALVLLALTFFYLFYRYRINQLLQLQNVRNRIAADLHDDIGSTLTNISILTTLSEKHLAQPEQAGKFLHRISDEVNTSNQALDDIIWSVNAKNDNLEETIARMRRYAAEVFDAAQIVYHLDLDENVSGKKLDMEKRRDLFLIYKEALNNIYKHAKASEVWIESKLEQNIFNLRIRDNGTGFDSTGTTHRNGLKNIHSRVEKWNGTAIIESKGNKGTTISIRFPI